MRAQVIKQSLMTFYHITHYKNIVFMENTLIFV